MIPPIEKETAAAIKRFQEERLREHLKYLYIHSPFYKNLFLSCKIDIKDIVYLEDLQKIPVTAKKDLQDYNDDFFCVPREKIIDFASTSGTLGRPVSFGLTDKDLDRLAYNEAISFACAGVRKGDVVQLMTTMDRKFMAGLAYFLGIRKLGAGIIRTGAGIPEFQWDSILSNRPDYLVTIPSFLLKMIDFAEKNNIDLKKASVKAAICIGEPLRNQDLSPSELARKISSKWNIRLFSTYASTEMSTAFTECEFRQGGHLHPELIIAEVVDKENNPVAEGETGELTVTPLGIEGLPLLRFKTGDLVKVHSDKCPCGRNTPRIGPVLGRTQHMIKYKGTTIYPPAMHDALNTFDEITGHVIIIQSNEIGTDDIIVKIATENKTDAFLQKVNDHFRAKLRVTPTIEMIGMEDLSKLVYPVQSRKPQTVIDRRRK